MAKKTTKQKIQKTEDAEVSSRIKTLRMEELLPQVMSNIVIREIDGFHTQLLPDNMTGDKYKTFKKSRGGVFSRDSLAFLRNKPHGEYFLYKSDEERFIGRIITDEELLQFQALHLVDGKIVDANYMKLRNLAEDEKLTNSVRYIKEKSDELMDDDLETIVTIDSEVEEDPEAIISSVSLFDE